MILLVFLVLAAYTMAEYYDVVRRRKAAESIEALKKEYDELLDDADATITETVQDIDRILQLAAEDRHDEAWRELIAVEERLIGIDSSPAAAPVRFAVDV